MGKDIPVHTSLFVCTERRLFLQSSRILNETGSDPKKFRQKSLIPDTSKQSRALQGALHRYIHFKVPKRNTINFLLSFADHWSIVCVSAG